MACQAITRRLRLCLALLSGAALLGGPAAWAAPSPGTIYVPAFDEDAIEVFDTVNAKLTASIPVGQHPLTLRALPDSSKIYVDNYGPNLWQISVIGTDTNRVIKTIPMLGAPYASFELTHDGRLLYVPTNANVVQVIDTRLDAVVRTIAVGNVPISVNLSPDGLRLYVGTNDNNLYVFDTTTSSRIATVALRGDSPGWSEITPDGRYLFVLNFDSSTIDKVDTQSLQVVDTITLPAGSTPVSGQLTKDGKRLWVANTAGTNIAIIDVATDQIINVIPLQTSPTFVGFSPDGTRAYVSDLGPLTSVPSPLRLAVLLAFVVGLPPGIAGNVTTYDSTTLKPVAPPLKTGTGPTCGVYF